MTQRLCRWLLYKVLGFTFEETVARPEKCIIALAPHTSNWDFILGLLFSRAEGFRCGFLMKKEWFFWPLGPLFRRIGGVPVHRTKNHSLTDQLAEQARSNSPFRLCITPEGTRKLQPEWKRGFYYIAQKADIPILLYGLDYPSRRIVCTQSVTPTGDIEREMRELKLYFQPFRGKHPKQFTTGL